MGKRCCWTKAQPYEGCWFNRVVRTEGVYSLRFVYMGKRCCWTEAQPYEGCWFNRMVRAEGVYSLRFVYMEKRDGWTEAQPDDMIFLRFRSLTIIIIA
jgi:hypothetical protein